MVVADGLSWKLKQSKFFLFTQLNAPLDYFRLELTLDFALKCSHKFLLTLRRLMSYIYMEHPFLMFLDHTQRRSTVGRTPLDE